eukprot:scaffold35231_cov17-Tisochrysis_lutea.AAC.1
MQHKQAIFLMDCCTPKHSRLQGSQENQKSKCSTARLTKEHPKVFEWVPCLRSHRLGLSVFLHCNPFMESTSKHSDRHPE